jgi:hypothetical protein
MAGFDVAHVTARPVSTALLPLRTVAVATVVAPLSIVDCASDTLTLATGACVTVSTAVPLRPSLLAVIVVVPGVIAAMPPEASTVAMAVFEDDQMIVRPVSASFDALRSVAVAMVLDPALTDDAARLTVTVATGTGVTVSVADPLRPSLVAVMLVLPSLSAVMAPVPDTDATAGLLELQVTVRPLSEAPVLLRVSAVATVLPPIMSCAVPSETITLATGAGAGGGAGVVGASPPPPQAARVTSVTSRGTSLTMDGMGILRMMRAAMGHPSHTTSSRRGVTALRYTTSTRRRGK